MRIKDGSQGSPELSAESETVEATEKEDIASSTREEVIHHYDNETRTAISKHGKKSLRRSFQFQFKKNLKEHFSLWYSETVKEGSHQANPFSMAI